MTEPKFAIGDRVAVCSSTLDVVIPDTTAVSRVFKAVTISKNQLGRILYNVWCYRVSGHDGGLAEWCLRPIDKDEYTDQAEEKERTA